MMDRNQVSCVLILVALVMTGGGCQKEPVENLSTNGCCPQEMCLYVFDRLEEETQRWRNVEEALRRTIAILAVDERLAGLSAALKADPAISSLLDKAEPGIQNYSTPSWMTNPVVLLRESQQDSSKVLLTI